MLHSISQLSEKHQKTFYPNLTSDVTFCLPLLEKISDLVSLMQEIQKGETVKQLFLNLNALKVDDTSLVATKINYAKYSPEQFQKVKSQLLAYQLIVISAVTARKIRGSMYPRFLSTIDNTDQKETDISNCITISCWARWYLTLDSAENNVRAETYPLWLCRKLHVLW